MDKEIRVMKTNFEVKNGEENEKTKVVGYAALFDDPADENMGFIEKISPGAFDKALKKSDTRALINHNPEKILGRVKSGTLKLKEDSKGLYYEVDPPETTYAQDLMKSMDRGDIDQSSFGFTVSVEKWDDSGDVPVRTIVEVDELFDVSPVTYPWYENTESGLKNREKVFEEHKANYKEKEVKNNEVLNKIVKMEIKHKID
ncbi:HK97 family phage prohead protease [Halanaerobium salsuginis]|uniref:Prohead serine protease domain-containing protein n=1 Tax=Halanaerobium salsuginis TaxID=29563 RepID=A0A1I4LTQ8_9FIRM|nr:HK97 family phage prohead protease [Halanaerobium salsuginis]SFL93967.1 hypothetical protein SAMN02983006_02400 [Halanaerobium salsuginis]